jgi:VWFA-related protein
VATLGAASALLQGQAQPTFRSGTDIVRLDVRVVDNAGRPITDLRQDEIEIVEEGQPRPTVYFQRVSEPAELFVDQAARAVTAEVSSNEAFPRGHLYLLVFDQTHITTGNEQRARLAAEQFVRRHVRPSDRVALFAIPGPGPQVGFTADRTRLLDELARVRGTYQRVATTPFGNLPVYDAHRIAQGDDRLINDTMERLAKEGGGDVLGVSTATTTTRGGAIGGEDPAIARRLLIENAQTIVKQTDAESRQLLQRLADVIRGLGDIEGRKTVVYFSEGFFQDNLSQELEDVAAAAAQTYSVFYALDLNSRMLAINEASPASSPLGSEVQARLAPLGSLAVETAGELIIDASTRVDDALTRIATEAQDYYLVGFEPSAAALAKRGEYRRVKVRVTRPGARVSSRTGYALRSNAVTADRQRAISAVLGAPFVQQGLKLDYTTYLMKADVPGQQRVIVSLSAQLPVRSRDGETADVVFVARDVRDGRVVASGSDSLPLPAAPAAGSTAGIGTWRVQFSVPAGNYLMRAVVREPGGLAGSADRRIEVRALDTPDIAVSDLILGSSATAIPVRATAHVEDGLSGVIESYARAANQLQDLSLTVSVRTIDGTQAFATYTSPLPAPVADGRGFIIRAPFQVPLSGVTPGAYVAYATVTSREGVLAERTRFVDVVPGTSGLTRERPATAPPAPAPVVAPSAIVEGQLGQALVAELLELSRETSLSGAADDAVRGQWERVEAATRTTPADAPAFVGASLRALARFVREDYKGATEAWDEARTAEPQHALTLFFLGWAQDRSGDTIAALTSWRGAAHIDPLMTSAHLALADGYLKLKQPALARQALRAGLDAIPNSPELLTRLREIEGGQ